MIFPAKVMFYKVVPHKIWRRNDTSRSILICVEKKLWSFLCEFMRISMENRAFLSKIDFLTPKMIFPGKVMFYKVVPHKIWRRNDTSRSILICVEKKLQSVLCEFMQISMENNAFLSKIDFLTPKMIF